LIKNKNIPVFESIHKLKDIIIGDYGAVKPIVEFKGKKVCAFCGIAKPDSFRTTLSGAGVQILSFSIFPDHHIFKKSELEKIKKEFVDCRADYLMTTEKDAMRLQGHPEFVKTLSIVRVEMEMKPSAQSFENYIIEKIESVQA